MIGTRFQRRILMMGLTVVTLSTLSPPAAQAANSPQQPLRATVYDARDGAAVDLVGRIHVVAAVNGSVAQGWTTKLSTNLDSVTGATTPATVPYTANGAASGSTSSPPGPFPGTVTVTPTFVLRPPSPAKGQPFPLMLVVSLTSRGDVSKVEVRSPAPPLAFAVDPGVVPNTPTVPGVDGGPARPVDSLADGLGNQMDFVADELTITTSDPAELQGLLDRWGGQVLRTVRPADSSVAPIHVVRLTTTGVDVGGLSSAVADLDDRISGKHRASSAAALRLFAVAVKEKSAGHHVGVNVVYEPTDYVDRTLTEAPKPDPDPATGVVTSNSAAWSMFAAGGGDDFGVTEGWRMLAVGGSLGNRVKVGIIDVGCQRTHGDYPPGTTGGDDVMATKGGDPWHCTNVATTAGGVTDNSFGTAGSGGPVTDLRLYPTDMTDDNAARQVYAASRDQVAMINMSFKADDPAIANLLDNNLEDAIDYVHGRGMLVIAAAGNAKPREGKPAQDVDHVTCYFVCVESTLVRPCEFDGVTCVGGLKSGTHDRDPGSYYCLERRSSGVCDVDVFAPFTVYMAGSRPGGPGNPGNSLLNEATLTQGTSFSAPYVAGVAALMLAANPRLNNLQIEGILSNGLATTDPSVTAPVNARAAVLRAYGGNVPPSVRILTPNDRATVDYGGVNATRLSATTFDIEQGTDVVDVSWSSDVDGPLGSGATIDYVFATPGPRRVTARAKDRLGAVGTTSVLVTATNREPVVRIVSPGNYAKLYTGATYQLRAEVQDQINAPQPELCQDVVWTSDYFQDKGFPKRGCAPTVVFSGQGWRTLTASYTDAEGATGKAEIDVEVVDPPADSPPVVVIDSPSPGATFLQGATIPLRGSVYLEPGESSPVEYSWYLNGVLIEEAMNIDFGPSSPGYVTGESVLTFGARDDDGYAQTSIGIRIAARPK